MSIWTNLLSDLFHEGDSIKIEYPNEFGDKAKGKNLCSATSVELLSGHSFRFCVEY